MEPYDVIRAERADNGLVTHVVATENGERNIKYHDIRAGLSWPTGMAQGYYCILGEEYKDFHRFDGGKRRGELRLLVEYEYNGISMNDLFANLTDDTAMLECRSIYTNTGEAFQGQVESYREFCNKTGARTGNLTQAPYVDNFLLGISWIQDRIKEGLLPIPETSVIYSQLKTITKAELAEVPEEKFPAINGLRFVVGAFHKYRTMYPHFVPDRSAHRRRG